jgi:hypothetical protein
MMPKRGVLTAAAPGDLEPGPDWDALITQVIHTLSSARSSDLAEWIARRTRCLKSNLSQ